jgi:hypothetical protein
MSMPRTPPTIPTGDHPPAKRGRAPTGLGRLVTASGERTHRRPPTCRPGRSTTARVSPSSPPGPAAWLRARAAEPGDHAQVLHDRRQIIHRLRRTPRADATHRRNPKELEAVRPLHRTRRSAHRTLSLPECAPRSAARRGRGGGRPTALSGAHGRARVLPDQTPWRRSPSSTMWPRRWLTFPARSANSPPPRPHDGRAGEPCAPPRRCSSRIALVARLAHPRSPAGDRSSPTAPDVPFRARRAPAWAFGCWFAGRQGGRRLRRGTPGRQITASRQERILRPRPAVQYCSAFGERLVPAAGSDCGGGGASWVRECPISPAASSCPSNSVPPA